MRFLWKDTFVRLTGSYAKCPCCGRDGLIVTERTEKDVLPDLRGIPYCECAQCLVRGDVAELVAKATNSGVEDAVRELRRRRELEASERDIDTYILRKNAQVDVDWHMGRCIEKLRLSPHLCNIRAGLSVATLRQLPPDTGMHIVQDAPRHFAILSAPRYSMVPMTLYRYTFDGETSCIDAQNPKTLQREHRIRITGDVGVYLGHYREGEVPPVVVGTHNPRTAGQIYGAMRAESSLTPPIIGIAGFPLPHKFSGVSKLYLLDTVDSPLPLSFAIQAMQANLVYGAESSPGVRVLSPKCTAADITAADIRMLSNSSQHGITLGDWVAGKLLASADRTEEIANALLQAGASENVRAAIAELLGDRATESLRTTIMLPTTVPDDIFELGSGKLIKNTPIGLYTAFRQKRTGEITTKSLLCNVGISVDARIVDRGMETAVCTVTHPDADVPSVSVRIPHTHWNNQDAIAADIRSAYSSCGRTPYIAFYRISGYSWGDVFQYLGSHCPVQSGIKSLGATPDGCVNLPNVRIAQGKIGQQTKAGLIDPSVSEAYSALRQTDGKSEFGIPELLDSTVTLDKTGVAAGILHTLFCTAGRMYDTSGVRRPPSHLLFVETEPGIWDSTLRTLSYILSGSEYVPLMDYSDRLGFLHAWSQLGTLPLITRLPASDDMAAVLAASPVSVMAVADPLTAVQCSGRGTVSFVLPHVENATADKLSPDDIAGIRASLVAVMAERAGTGWLDIGTGGPVSLSTPCLSALGSLSEIRDPWTVAGGLYRSVKGRYLGAGLTGARAFFGVLHRAYTAATHKDNASLRLTMVTGAPADTVAASFNERGEHIFILPEYVLVSRSVIPLINREQGFLFDPEQLSHEFSENGIILRNVPDSLGIDERRVWVFPRNVWDSEVVRAAGYATTRKDTK